MPLLVSAAAFDFRLSLQDLIEQPIWSFIQCELVAHRQLMCWTIWASAGWSFSHLQHLWSALPSF